jgi:hypothetical protein
MQFILREFMFAPELRINSEFEDFTLMTLPPKEDLFALASTYYDRGDIRNLDTLYQLMSDRVPLFSNIWFILYKNKFPTEILCAFEFDYFSQYPCPSSTTTTTTRLGSYNPQFLLIDQTLNINYSTLKAPREPVRVFISENKRDGNRICDWLYKENQFVILNNLLLNPIGEWTVFHVKMRRLAFLLLRSIIIEFQWEEYRASITSYARNLFNLKTFTPNSREDIVEAFLPDESFGNLLKDDWRCRIRHLYEDVESSMNFIDVTDNSSFLEYYQTPGEDQELRVNMEKFAFMYNDSLKERFRERIHRIK